MLKEITISNYALIDYLRIDLSKGFTTITGETGAGKSIILGGLSLALGKRAELNLVKDKTKKCFVDLLFSLKNLELKNLFNSLDLDYDTLTTIRREIIPSGKSRAFVNDTPVNLEILQKLSFELIDIHSQFQNHFIIKEEYQMDILDLLAKNKNLIEKYTLNFSHFKEVKNKINKLESSRINMNQEKDYNTYLLNEINSIDFSDSLDSMEKALKKISNSEEINKTFNQISNILQNEENGISIKLNEVRVSLKNITNFSNEYKRIFERIESIIIELDDIVRDVRNENDIMEFNPEMREVLSEKLEKIYSLFRKHQVDKLDDLILIKRKLEKKVSETENIDAIINEEKKKLVELELSLNELSKKISQQRKKVIPVLKSQMKKLLKDMGMVNTSFKIELYDSDIFLNKGRDKLLFNFSANKGGLLGPLSKTASSGELSRIMLALKSILSNYKNLPTIIFDEIDTGVSGEIANCIGRIMKSMSINMQVISITHLPQVAAKANNHLKVFKITRNEKTSTELKNLNINERVSEIAEMLSGDESAVSAYDLAKELLN
ncbi:MAG: DNA repair protein RecN [Flavobacteriales bacterium TMED96]|nr:MAG: DNA repair protein RecN [Flavobacteriales bacterium TMED96]